MTEASHDDARLETLLVRLRRTPPPLASIWRPGQAMPRPGRLRWSTALAAALAVLALTSIVAVAAVSSGAGTLYQQGKDCQPDTCGPAYTVVATSIDSRVIAFNVIVKGDTSSAHLRALASQFVDRHPGMRVIAYYFSDATGDEAEGFGSLPTSDEGTAPAPVNGHSHWLGTVDTLSNGKIQEIYAR
jgi:uncharacterized membrane protein